LPTELPPPQPAMYAVASNPMTAAHIALFFLMYPNASSFFS
jgi:hypothetical protein